MNLYYVTVIIATVIVLNGAEVSDLGNETVQFCDKNLRDNAVKALVNFSIATYQTIADISRDHFVHSPYSAWLMLSAIAEATTGELRTRLFRLLSLPFQENLREKFYEAVHDLENSGSDATFLRIRSLAVDDSLKINETWAHKVIDGGLLNATAYFPIKSNPQAASERMAKLLGSQYPVLDVDFSGNTILLSSLDFTGLWTTTFPKCEIEENATFYNEFGVDIGKIDLFHMNTRVKLSYLRKYNSKAIQIPFGEKGRFSFIFLQNIEPVPIKRVTKILDKNIMHDIFNNARLTDVPMKIAIPRFIMQSQYDNMRQILERVGVPDIWDNSDSVPFISTPSSSISAYVQHVKIKVDASGLNPYYPPQLNESAVNQTDGGKSNMLGQGFILNRPFLFALSDTETKTPLFAGSFSKPYLNNV